MQEMAKHFQVVALDLRSHGDSDKPKWGYHVARLAADLRDLLEVLDAKVHLCLTVRLLAC